MRAELTSQTRDKASTLIFVTTYNPRMPNIKTIIDKYMPTLKQDA
jgi:hypothetical protein